jgi:hypothetical protein
MSNSGLQQNTLFVRGGLLAYKLKGTNRGAPRKAAKRYGVTFPGFVLNRTNFLALPEFWRRT